MIYFVVAQHNDARPIIEYYGLKRDMAPCPFPIFLADGVALCLSDNGRANAAAATAYLLSRWGRDGVFVHLSPSLGLRQELLYPHTITDGTDRVYQEMLYKAPCNVKEGCIEDGQALYAYMAAWRFLPLKQIIVLQGKIDEGVFLWLELICKMSFPTFIWKKGPQIIP